MVFSSILFLFIFLPLLLIYYFVPFRAKNFIILIFSLFFYSWGEPKYFPVIILTILINYLIAIIIDKTFNKVLKKSWLLLAILFDVGELVFFKYYNFFIENINLLTNTNFKTLKLTLPLGISFYIFQILSYVIDVFRKKVNSEKNLVDFSAFVVLFPQLIAGPIVKYTDINNELKNRKITLVDVQDGLKIFILGLGKKVLIANNIGSLWSTVENLGFQNISSVLAWLGIIAFALQIYFDFSGYSLMAIGLGRMLGFHFPQNFNYPYLAKSVTEFWRRWHITLSSWFKEYLYIPLGGSKCSKSKMTLNLLIVWAVTGFWHGANWNFIFWGLFFFVFLILEKFFLFNFLTKHKIISHIYLLFLVLISWALFTITNINQLKLFILKLFCFDFHFDWLYILRNYFVILVVSIVFSTKLPEKLYKKISSNIFLDLALFLFILILSVAYLVDATYNPFLYFRF